jgi:hypothetical protein
VDDAVRAGLSGAADTALVVPVPEAEPVIGTHRRQFDVAAGWGLPPHVVVLYPFVPPGQVDDLVCRRLAEVLAGQPAFDCTFAETAWFGQDEVLWLRPDPDEPFRLLTRAVHATFPDHPPYRGAHGGDPTPHVSIGMRRLGDLAGLRAAEEEVRRHLPVTTRVDRVALMAGRRDPGSWRLATTFPLGG